MHCKYVPCNTLTHSTNEDLLNIKREGDPKSRTLSRTSDTTVQNPETVCPGIADTSLKIEDLS